MKRVVQATDETGVTDIQLMPDGRIYLFGASEQILQLLDDLQLADAEVRSRLQVNRSHDTQRPTRLKKDG